MYKEKLTFENQVFHDEEELVAQTFTIDRGLRAGGAEGKLKATLRATEDDVVVDSATTITMTITDCDTEDGTYAAIDPTLSRVFTPAADTTYKKNEAIMDIPIPEGVRAFVKPTLIVGGTIGDTEGLAEVILEFIP